MDWLAQENLFWLVVAAVLGAAVTAALVLVRVKAAEKAAERPSDEPSERPAHEPAEPARVQEAEAAPVIEPEREPEPAPEHEPAPGPTALVEGTVPGAAEPLPDGSSPSRHFAIKGNAASMKYHTAASPYYRRVRAEWWFDSEEAARSAGFRRWDEKDPAADAPPPAPMPVEDATLFDVEPEAAGEAPASDDPAHPYGDGSAAPLDQGRAPGPDYTVKAVTRSMTFHTPESPWFARICAEVWFDSEESARAAGFARWDD